MSTTKCGYCAEQFTEDQGQPTCASCPLKGGCRYLRCPNCGYENPCEPEWMGRLKRLLHTDDARARGSLAGGHDRDERAAASVR